MSHCQRHARFRLEADGSKRAVSRRAKGDARASLVIPLADGGEEILFLDCHPVADGVVVEYWSKGAGRQAALLERRFVEGGIL